jgi:ABC-type uncharacterized transport system ATPase subunit
LFDVLAGLERPAGGSIRVAGRELSETSPAAALAAGIGFDDLVVKILELAHVG